jgi:lipopolysaccharide export system permease protein
MNPHDFLFQKHKDVVLAVNLDLETLLTTRLYEDYEKMPFWQLSKRIDTLRQSGSNVETLVTAWHMKLSYAFTVVVMILIGLVVARMLENIYLNISLGLCLTFLFYHLYVLGGTLGENGVVPPWLGAWLAHCVFGVPALLLLLRKQGFKRSLF